MDGQHTRYCEIREGHAQEPGVLFAVVIPPLDGVLRRLGGRLEVMLELAPVVLALATLEDRKV